MPKKKIPTKTEIRADLLITDLNDKTLDTTVIYGFERREIEIRPYGDLWTVAKLNEMVNYFEKLNKKQKEIDGDIYLFLGYINSDKYKLAKLNKSKINKKNQINSYSLRALGDYLTYCRVLDVESNKKTAKSAEDLVYTFTLQSVGRYLVSQFGVTDKNMRDPKQMPLVSVSSIQGKKVVYHEPQFDFDLTDIEKEKDQIVDAHYSMADKLNNIEKAVTGLSENKIYQVILEARLKHISRKYNAENWAFTIAKSNQDIPPQSRQGLINIISLLSLYLAIDNKTKYYLFSLDNLKDQIDVLYKELESFFYLYDWNESQLKFLSTFDVFKDLMAKEQDKSNQNDENQKDELTKNLDKKSKYENDDQSKPKPMRTEKDVITEAKIDAEIDKKVRENMNKQQKEFMLREKLKAIKESLSENNPGADAEDDEFQKTINDPNAKLVFPKSVIKTINHERERLKSMMSGTPDANTTLTYINTLKKMPWRKVEIETLDIAKAQEVLDKNHYGLKEVKERIVEYLSLIINHKNRALKANKNELISLNDHQQIDLSLFKEEENNNKAQKVFNNVPVLTLVGPPGTGKTSLARSIAEALNKSYIKISLGGVHDESEIRGHRRTYVGSMPGKIIKAIQRAGVSNPLILLDEIDKMSSDYKGDPTSAMLEVLDPEQNSKFQDNYLEHEYDLSKVMFIATANYYENIPAPLIDRVEILELHSYTINEKIRIAREHLVNISIRQAGLDPNQFLIDDKTIEFIIKRYTAEAGVRSLKRQFDKIARKIVKKIVCGENIKKYKITIDEATKFLGTPKFSDDLEKDKKPQVGVVNGLAYTSIGGTTLQIEVSSYPGKNGIKLTGSLKDVMKESANISLSYVKANAKKFGIDKFDFENNEVHIHVPEGAVPKDGPSAGVTFTTALISALSNKKVPQDIAMTGEITLRGRVLEIGGLKEKSFSAFKKGIKKVYIPKGNEKNLNDIPDEVKEAITFVSVSQYEEIYNDLFKTIKK